MTISQQRNKDDDDKLRRRKLENRHSILLYKEAKLKTGKVGRRSNRREEKERAAKAERSVAKRKAQKG